MRSLAAMRGVRVSTLLLACALLSRAQDDDTSTWNLVVPAAESLPSVAPPSTYNRSKNTITPLGVSSELGEARPALLHTNKFYSNFVIDGPSRAAWALPYLVSVNDAKPFGMIVSHPSYFGGETTEDGTLKWYATASNKDLVITAKELNTNQNAALTDFDDEGLSATVTFTSEDHLEGNMTTYLVRGMAYATALYEEFTPEVSSIHAMLRVNGKSVSEGNHTSPDGRFVVELNDGKQWILYSSDHDLEFVYSPAAPNEPYRLRANSTMTGTLRAALVPYDVDSALHPEAVSVLDAHAGVYPIKGEVSGWMNTTDEHMGQYSLSWVTGGNSSGDLIHYALPHHQGLLASDVKTGIFLSSPTKGEMELVKGSTWTMTENSLPNFQWIPSVSDITSATEMAWVEFYLEKEISQTLNNVAGSSVYFGAKNLMAYAQLCLIAGQIGRDDLIETCVDQVEAGFDQYVQGNNGNPLVYDEVWGGVIGSLGLEEGNEGADFYAAFYNDHHFHYSYLLNAAAVLARLRPSWATAENKNWVDTLIRDVNNPNKDDAYFPQFRSFDWFCGHSWARGLLFAYDGKDQESTSEDVNFFYAMTMWAIATGNSRLEGLGRLQTGIVARSLDAYFLLKDTNTNHPAEFVRNKVTGIFFESKVDYTTWFGDNTEYIHGIQNIPVTAVTEYIRTPEFVREEWDQKLAVAVGSASGVWTTVLYMSYATVQKHLAFRNMLSTGVDDGLLRSWALYWAATRPDCILYCNHDEVAIADPPTPTPAPITLSGAYLGVPSEIPGTIQVENFDYGGQGVAYSDTDPGNNGGAIRTDEDVDIKVSEDGVHYVGWTRDDEYLRYTVDVKTAGDSFDFEFSVAAPDSGGSLRVVAGGTGCSDYETDLSGLVEVETTGGWNLFATQSISGEATGGLSAGSNVIWLCVVKAGFNIDSFSMTPSATSMGNSLEIEDGPYLGIPATIPGTVEAEKFDHGGNGVAYGDADAGNSGQAFRTEEMVDIGLVSGGYYIGWTVPGEFLRYTVDVQTSADAFDFEILVAAPSGSAGSFRVVSGGTGCSNYETDLSGLMTVISTGSWHKFVTQTMLAGGSGGLAAGLHTLWLCIESSGFNIDSFTMSASSST